MDEIIQAGQRRVVDAVAAVNSSVVLYLEAERAECRVLPEIQAAGNFEVGPVRGVLPGSIIVVDEEEGVAPFVGMEAFQCGGDYIAVLAEIVEYLQVGLGFQSG